MQLPQVSMAYKHAATFARKQSGQASLEYALVMGAFASLLMGLGLLHQVLSNGLFVEHALQSASHVITNVSQGVLRDVFLV